MVSNNHSLESGLRNLLAEAKSELDALTKERQALDDKILALATEVDAYEYSLQGYLKRTGRQTVTKFDWSTLADERNHKERLIKIAELQGGEIKVSSASSLLYTKGFIKSKRSSNAYQIVRGLLEEMVEENRFEKIRPGEYRLVGSQQSLLT